jgi:hypothetical protein
MELFTTELITAIAAGIAATLAIICPLYNRLTKNKQDKEQ